MIELAIEGLEAQHKPVGMAGQIADLAPNTKRLVVKRQVVAGREEVFDVTVLLVKDGTHEDHATTRDLVCLECRFDLPSTVRTRIQQCSD